MRIVNGILLNVSNQDIGSDGSFVVPSGVKRIGSSAFCNCSGLTSVTIPYSVTSIGWYAFSGCSELTSFSFPPNITSIGGCAFENCSSLKSTNKNYKAFFTTKYGRLFCSPVNRRKYYEVGKKSMVRGDLSLCRNGIHYCTNMFDIFDYYSGEYGKEFVIGICEVSKENIGEDGTSKRCARWVKPTKILTREEVIKILNGEDIE